MPDVRGLRGSMSVNYIVSLAVGFRLQPVDDDAAQVAQGILEQVGDGCCFWLEDNTHRHPAVPDGLIIGPTFNSSRGEIVVGSLAVSGELTFEEAVTLGPELERIRQALITLGHINDLEKPVVTLTTITF